MKENLRERLDEEIGQPYIDIENGFTFGPEEDLTFLVRPEISSQILRGDPLLAYDLKDEHWYGVEVKEVQIMKTSTLDRERDLYAIDQDTLVDRYLERQEMFDDPAIIKVEPIASFSDGTRRAANKCPSSASVLLRPRPTEEETIVEHEPGLGEILGLPTAGIPLGAVSVDQRAFRAANGDSENPYLEFKLDLEQLSNKHVVVFGASGQGKTSFLKHSSKRLGAEGYGIIFFDIQGDIIQTLFHPERNPDQQDLLEEEFHSDFLAQIRSTPQLPDDVETNVYFPVTEHVDDDDRNRISNLCDAAGANFIDFSLRFRNVESIGELAHFIEIASPQAQAAIDEVIYSDEEVDLDTVIREMENATADRGDFDEIAIPGIGINSRYYGKTYGSALRALRQIQRAGVYDARQVEEPQMYGNAGEYNTVYLAHLDQMSTRHMVEKHIMGYMRQNKEQVDEPGVYIVLDEAHEIVPAEATTASPKAVTDRLVREFDKMAREGRKYNINLIVSTHYPGDINQVVQSICDTTVVMGISETDAQRAGVPKEYQNEVSNLDRGYAYINTASSTTAPWTQVRIPSTDLLHMDISEWGVISDEIVRNARDDAIDDDEEGYRDMME